MRYHGKKLKNGDVISVHCPTCGKYITMVVNQDGQCENCNHGYFFESRGGILDICFRYLYTENFDPEKDSLLD